MSNIRGKNILSLPPFAAALVLFLSGLMCSSCLPGLKMPVIENDVRLPPRAVSIVEWKTDEFVAVRPGRYDSFRTLAARYLYDAQKGWLISNFNERAAVIPGELLLIPLKPIYLGGLNRQGVQTVPVLTYHRFSKKQSNGMTVRAEDFDRQMQYLKKNRFKTVSLDHLLDFMEFKSPLPEKSVVITIDDGWSSAYQIAFPILKKYGLKAALFVYTDFVGGGKALTWPQIKEMAEYGIEIQNHGKSHRDLTAIQKNETFEEYFLAIKKEIKDAEKIIKEKVGGDCRFFAYPFGHTNPLVTSLVKKMGYRGAFTVDRGSTPFFKNRGSIPRSIIHGGYTIKDFEKNLSFREALTINGFQ